MSRSVCMCALALTMAAMGCTESAGVGAIGVTCPDGTEERGGDCVLPVRVAVGPSSVGPAREGRAFIVQFEAAGGEAPYTYRLEGELPSGLSFAQTGELSGTPAEGSAGQYALSVIASDVNENLGEVSLTLSVEEAILDPECEPSDEVCDGLDNDCDGVVDNAPVDVGETCGPTEGVCQRGTSACVDGEVVCEGVVEQGEEVCDGVDNDCDGQVDEDLLNACGECGDVPEEVCDGEDNDCDGQTDEGLLNACGECGDVPEEVCDGEDNDCDGQIDEGVRNACGECGDVPVEVCDGEDNDCDGEADEGCPCETGQREACGLSEGVCVPGERECVGGVWGACEGGRGPSPEACDGEDNDCDGEADEGVLNACGECGAVPEEVCDGVDNDCDGQTDEGVLNACGECGAVPEEVCDGVDNDCDGQTDEGLEALGACDVDEAPCGGQRACVDGEVVCEAVAPSEEVCDGVDNDCDGETDEDEGGQPLSRECGRDGCDSRGVQVCAQGGFGDCVFPQEVCDGADNDCNGQVDDAVPGVGERCGEGDTLCERGLTACVDGELICDGVGQGSPEVCDGVDNDCDGAVDEEIADVGQACAVDRCGTGALACAGARGLFCDVEPVNAGTVQRVSVEGGFARSYTGTAAPFFSDQGQSYSVLLASDGERIYNVSFGIDDVPFAGWTVRIFVPTDDGLQLQEELTIPASWAEEGVQPFGFAGVAAKDGVLTVLNVASSNFPGSVWTVDTQEEAAEVEYLWEDRNTFEAPAEYDWNRDLFWTIQLNSQAPVVFAYEGSGIDPDAELERFQVFGDAGLLGNIASDGVNLYGLAYSNAQQPQEVFLARFGSGFGGTAPGGDFRRLAQVRAAASLTFHRDGYLYIPDHNNLGQVVRVAATVGPNAEVCDGFDNDCDGVIDEGACEGPDIAVGSAGAVQVEGGQRAVRLEYSVVNRAEAVAGAHADVVFLASPDAPAVSLATLGTFERGPLGVNESRRYEEVMTLPEDLPEGDWLLNVFVDQRQETGDVDRSNNRARVEFFFEEPVTCEVDEFDSGVRNDTFEDAAPLSSLGRFTNLTLCPGDDEDWFVVTVPRFRGQSFLLESEQGVSLDMVIFNEDGDIVAEGSTENTGSSILRVMTGNREADFFVLIKNADPEQGPTTYRLSLGGI